MRTRCLAASLMVAAIAVACTEQSRAPGDAPATISGPTFDVTEGGSSADVPVGEAAVPTYVEGGGGQFQALVAGAVIRVYQDEMPWFGANRAHTTILSLGKVLGTDYFIHPLSALAAGIPAGTATVVITSNSTGSPAQAVTQNSAASQASLSAFLATGGTLVVDMGDNLPSGGFIAPGAAGTPTLVFPSPGDNATLVPAALGHPIVLGPDGAPGGGDDLTDANIDACCFVAHGNLEEGVTLPAGATAIMTATFAGVERTIMAEYCVGGGRVILDTNTKEFVAQQPAGSGPPHVMRNLFSYALSGGCVIPITVDIKPGSSKNPVNLGSNGLLPVAILTTPDFDAATIDPATVTLGDCVGTDTPVAARNKGTLHASLEDVDGDGDLDLMLKFSVPALVANGDLTGATTELCVQGATTDGLPVLGTDVVTIVPK